MDSNNGSTATMTTKTYFGAGFITFLAITIIYFKSSHMLQFIEAVGVKYKYIMY